MSAAATAAGYLYAHGYRAESQSSVRLKPETGLRREQVEAAKPLRTPKIEYRKRRWTLPVPPA